MVGVHLNLQKHDAEDSRQISLLIVWFTMCMIATSLGLGLLAYGLALVVGVWRAATRPSHVMPQIFCLLATSVITVPYDYHGHWGGSAPAPYWYWGAAIGLPAMVAFVRLGFGPEVPTSRICARRLPLALKGFIVVILSATAYGYVMGNGLEIILRQGSGLFFLFFFTFLGCRLAPTTSQMLDMFQKVRNVLIGYGSAYMAHYIYLNLRFIKELPQGVFLREPTPPLFFCGLFAALSVGQWLFWKERLQPRGFWIGTCVLALSAVLSGSRAAVACMVLTVAFFVLLKYMAHPLRLCAVLAVAALAVGSFRPQQALYSLVQGSPFLQHVAGRFAVAPQGDFSFVERASQLIATWEVFKSRPLLGQGIGANLVWFDPASLGWVETAFVDNGIGYLLLKTGSLGTLAFFWFLVVLFRKTWRVWILTRHPLVLGILGTLVYYTVFLPFEPAFFEFLFCFWVAAVIGYVLRMGIVRRSTVQTG